MSINEMSKKYCVIGSSVKGASHASSGLPNQDALGFWPGSAEGPPLVLAVSDGHGNARSFRSNVGSEIAVKTAKELLNEFHNERSQNSSNMTIIKRTMEERLPVTLIKMWKKAVDEDLKKNPIKEVEYEKIERELGKPAREDIENNMYLTYGATLLATLITENYMIFLQLGDGDIIMVSNTREVTRPLLKDEALIGNETTSLCLPNAADEFRVGFQQLINKRPALIMLSTDGYANSFSDDKGFMKVGSDILEMICSEGINKVKEDLEDWLIETTRAGSGDDITVGIIYRVDLTRQTEGPALRDNEMIKSRKEEDGESNIKT